MKMGPGRYRTHAITGDTGFERQAPNNCNSKYSSAACFCEAQLPVLVDRVYHRLRDDVLFEKQRLQGYPVAKELCLMTQLKTTGV